VIRADAIETRWGGSHGARRRQWSSYSSRERLNSPPAPFSQSIPDSSESHLIEPTCEIEPYSSTGARG